MGRCDGYLTNVCGKVPKEKRAALAVLWIVMCCCLYGTVELGGHGAYDADWRDSFPAWLVGGIRRSDTDGSLDASAFGSAGGNESGLWSRQSDDAVSQLDTDEDPASSDTDYCDPPETTTGPERICPPRSTSRMLTRRMARSLEDNPRSLGHRYRVVHP